MAAPRKTPQDRKQSAATVQADSQERFEDIEGHELLKPLGELKASDQARLTGRLVSMGLLADGADGEPAGEVDIESINFDALADLIDYVESRFVDDVDGWAAFSRGPGAMERTMSLVMAYAGEMGKGAA